MQRYLVLILLLLFQLIPTHASEKPFITLSSTTSTEDSGLLEFIIPKFSLKTGIDVRVIAVGTGRALMLGERGDVDVILVHHKPSEMKFIEAGFGIQRQDVMYNDFVIIGPKEDPANIKKFDKVVDAFKQIYQYQHTFISRGDDSGTHKKELEIWSLAGLNIQQHSGDWYLEVGAGMGSCLNIANSIGAYTLSDRGTWLSFKNRDQLTLLFENDPPLFNQYGVILVNPEKHTHIKYQHAKLFSEWLTSTEGQQAIASFKLEGQQLFFPNALPNIASSSSY